MTNGKEHKEGRGGQWESWRATEQKKKTQRSRACGWDSTKRADCTQPTCGGAVEATDKPCDYNRLWLHVSSATVVLTSAAAAQRTAIGPVRLRDASE